MKTNMLTILTLTIFAISILVPCAELHAAEAPPKEKAQAAVHFPVFSWDTVSTAMPPRKIPLSRTKITPAWHGTASLQ